MQQGRQINLSMRRFSEIIKDLELRDLPLQGGPYMWRGGLNNQSNSRLDRFLVSENWEGHSYQKELGRSLYSGRSVRPP